FEGGGLRVAATHGAESTAAEARKGRGAGPTWDPRGDYERRFRSCARRSCRISLGRRVSVSCKGAGAATGAATGAGSASATATWASVTTAVAGAAGTAGRARSASKGAATTGRVRSASEGAITTGRAGASC